MRLARQWRFFLSPYLLLARLRALSAGRPRPPTKDLSGSSGDRAAGTGKGDHFSTKLGDSLALALTSYSPLSRKTAASERAHTHLMARRRAAIWRRHAPVRHIIRLSAPGLPALACLHSSGCPADRPFSWSAVADMESSGGRVRARNRQRDGLLPLFQLVVRVLAAFLIDDVAGGSSLSSSSFEL